MNGTFHGGFDVFAPYLTLNNSPLPFMDFMFAFTIYEYQTGAGKQACNWLFQTGEIFYSQ
jgi:hypothetical protein